MSWLGAIRTATGGVLRHKVQAIVIGMVLLISTASATLGLALLAASNAPFQHAFSSQHGADVTVTVNPAHAGPAVVAAVIAAPAAVALNTATIRAMAATAHTGVPASFTQAFPPSRLALLSLAALAIAVAGALLPASWAARGRPAVALRTE